MKSSGYGAPAVVEVTAARMRRWLDPMVVIPDRSLTWSSQDEIPLVRSRILTPRASRLVAAFQTATIAQRGQNPLRVVDFGGAFGTHYYQIRSFLPQEIRLQWIVWETAPTAELGTKEFATEELQFASGLKEVREISSAPHIIIASSSLQYSENPANLFEELAGLGARYLILDRMPLIRQPRDRLTVQRVPAAIYPASYPAWFFSEPLWLERLLAEHELLMRWSVPEDGAVLDGRPVSYYGFLLRRQ